MNDHRPEPALLPKRIKIRETGSIRHAETREQFDSARLLWGYSTALLVSLGVTLAATPLLPYLAVSYTHLTLPTTILV